MADAAGTHVLTLRTFNVPYTLYVEPWGLPYEVRKERPLTLEFDGPPPGLYWLPDGVVVEAYEGATGYRLTDAEGRDLAHDYRQS